MRETVKNKIPSDIIEICVEFTNISMRDGCHSIIQIRMENAIDDTRPFAFDIFHPSLQNTTSMDIFKALYLVNIVNKLIQCRFD